MNRDKFLKFKLSIRAVLVDYWTVLLICPALFLFIFSNELNIIGLNGLVYRKQCLLEFNATICNDIHNYNNESILIQELSSEKQMWLNISFIIPALFAIVHFSGMADKRLNYQIPLLVSAFGSILNTIILAVATDLNESYCFLLIFTAQVVNGIFGGGSLCFISSCFSHISIYEEKIDSDEINNDSDHLVDDQYKKKKSYRSIRFSLCESSLLFGQFFGSLISGYLIGNKTELIGFRRIFYTSTGTYLFVFLYVICLFSYLKRIKSTKYNTLKNEKKSKISIRNIFKNEISFFTDTFKMLTKKRENNARFHVISLLVIYFIGASVSMGLNSIQYLYLVKNSSIQLSQINYGYFKAINTLTRTVSLLIILPILKYYSLPDYWFYLIGITSEFLNLIVFSVSFTLSYLIWIGPIVYMFSSYFVVCIRIFASKLVEPNETGKFFGIIALVEFLVILVSSSIITVIYNATVATFPPLIYVISCAICVLFCYPFLIIIIQDLRKLNQSQTKNKHLIDGLKEESSNDNAGQIIT